MNEPRRRYTYTWFRALVHLLMDRPLIYGVHAYTEGDYVIRFDGEIDHLGPLALPDQELLVTGCVFEREHRKEGE